MVSDSEIPTYGSDAKLFFEVTSTSVETKGSRRRGKPYESPRAGGTWRCQNREDGRSAKEAWGMLITCCEFVPQLGCAEFVKQTRAGEGRAAPSIIEGLAGPSYNISFPGFRGPCFRGPGEFCFERERERLRTSQRSSEKHDPFDFSLRFVEHLTFTRFFHRLSTSHSKAARGSRPVYG